MACHVMSGQGNSQFKGPEAGACWTCSGNIPEASVAKGGGEGATRMSIEMGPLHTELVLDRSHLCLWSQPLINRHHPRSLRCLGLNDRVFGHLIQGGKKEWGR